MREFMLFCFTGALAVSPSSLLGGDEYLGAGKLMEMVASEVSVGDPTGDLSDAVRNGLRKMIEVSAESTEREAADAWVSLVAKYLSIPSGKRSRLSNEAPPFSLATLFEGLPRPEAWGDIRLAIDDLPADGDPLLRHSLHLISATLSGEIEKQLEAMENLKKSYLESKQGDTYARRSADQYFKQAEEGLRSGTDREVIAAFKKSLGEVEDGKDSDYGYTSLEIPAIAGAIPDEEAEALVLRALKTGKVEDVEGDPTKRFVARVMMENIDAVVKPLWLVVETAAEIKLFELMAEKFDEKEDWDFTSAENNYVMALLEQRESAKAEEYITRRAKKGAKVNLSLDRELVGNKKERVEEIFGFFGRLLKQDPTFPYWDLYGELAQKTGKEDEALLAMKAAMDSANEGTEQIDTLRRRIIEGLLSQNRVEEAITFLRDIVRKMSAEGVVSSDDGVRKLVNHSLRLARMARLLDKSDLEEEAFAAAEMAVTKNRKFTDSGASMTFQVVGELVKQGRGAKAEQLLADELVFASRLPGNTKRPRSDIMTALAYVYSEVGRHADVVALLEDGTMWDADDLADLSETKFDGKPLQLIAAESFHAVGRDEIASSLLNRVFESSSGNDDAYTLLLEIGGDGVISKLDRIHAKNRFEERPLIWKAKVLSDAGKLDEAEETAKAAIAIDPSDGEQGKGDRMRVYAVLGEIMGKKGNKEQQEFLEDVVKAIRLSEKGDDWWSAGMQKRAIAIYEESLQEFADAYCIQSRLALRYAEMGNFEKAEEHYRRAFELMPESFGRVESHCFGCEGAFSGELAQGIAEDVFEKLAKEMPDRAQVFYLLGYLRDEQGRKVDAAEHYAKAVEIDPDYINAWSKLGNVADEAGLSAGEKDRIALELFRLNPQGSSLSNVTNLSKLWSAALAADQTFSTHENKPVFQLKSSERLKGDNNRYYYGYYNRKVSPRSQLASHEMIRQTVQLLETLWRN